ncbi:ankyrin repeat-containing protein [Anaeramoeba flamelloides]|uniref:Ankyrin repeat-containing protein n=1 Tax=Anaeramoeba flamelloides TaxID=1746091 RepID=A0AAV7Y7T9_9EUKA|nr:ankyrin repeat-containing protein [Anaeramoeba flamelloides]
MKSLITALELNNIEKLNEAINEGFPENSFTGGTNPLHLATWYNCDEEIFDKLAKMGLSPLTNEPDDTGKTCLQYAALRGSKLHVWEWLLENNGDPNIGIDSECPVLSTSISSKLSHDVISLLLSKDAKYKINQDDQNSLLHLAIECDSEINILKEIINKFPDQVHHLNKMGLTPFLMACKKKSTFEVIKLLIESGSKTDAISKIKNTCLHYLCKTKPDPKIIEIVLKSGVNPNLENMCKRTCLHLAIMNNACSDAIGMLLIHGADPSLCDSFKQTALHYSYRSNLDAVGVLLKHKKADVTSLNVWLDTPLYVCILNQADLQILLLLLRAGSDPNFIGNNGNNSIHLLIESEYPIEAYILFLKYNAKMTIANKEGFAPINQLPFELRRIHNHMFALREDLLLLLKLNLGESSIQCSDSFKIHFFKAILLQRTNGQDLNSLISILEKHNFEIVQNFFKYIYGGVLPLESEKKKEIVQLGTQLGLKEKDFEGDLFQKLLDDLSRLRENEETMDFKIVVQNETFLIHKFILLARSKLLLGLEMSSKSPLSQYQETKDFPPQVMNQLINFLYTQDMEIKYSSEINNQMKIAINHYLLNPNNVLSLLLK